MALFVRASRIAPMDEQAPPPLAALSSAKPAMRGPGFFGRLGNRLRNADWQMAFAQMRDDPSFAENLLAHRENAAEQARREADAESQRMAAKGQNEQLRAAIDQLPEDQRALAWANPAPFIAAQAPMNEEERSRLDLSERQFGEQLRHNRTSEAIDWTRASRETQNGMPTLSEARQWTNSYNDDVRSVNSDLGNMRAAIPYANQVVQQRGNATGNFRMNDVALLRAAARAQTGPGVLTETEVFGTLSPSLQQDLVRARAYADIAQSGLRPEDRLALAQYVQQAGRNASGDLWRRYTDVENVLAPRNVDPNSIGISAPEYVHPDDMDSFYSVPLSNYRAGRSYVAPSGRRYQYTGNGRFRYTGREEYNRERVTVNRAPPAQPQGGGSAAQQPPPSGIDPTEWQHMTPQERQRVRELTGQ